MSLPTSTPSTMILDGGEKTASSGSLDGGSRWTRRQGRKCSPRRLRERHLCLGVLGRESAQVRFVLLQPTAPQLRADRSFAGKKFSQVEFVAFIMTLLASYRLKPTAPNSTSEGEAAKTLLGVVEDSLSVITPKMRRPDDAGVLFVKR